MVNHLHQPVANLDYAALVDRLMRWAACESPSSDAAAVGRMMDLALLEVVGHAAIAVERIAGRDGIGDIVILRAGPDLGRTGTLVIGHLDTVHPVGTAAGPLPIRVDGDRLYGPGLYDMKGGVFCALSALVQAADAQLERPVTLLLSPDEEIGSPTTRALIENLARSADQVLVVEPARAGGAAVTARKGVAWYQFDVQGTPSHAGTHHADGRSAIHGASELILQLEALTDYATGTTVSVGEITGGTARNVVPAHCRFTADIRVTNATAAQAIEQAVTSLKPTVRDLTVHISGGFNRPPYERTEGNAALLAHAQSLAEPLGLTLNDVPMVGGGSDGNFTSALGLPTLDGLGVEGGGAHTFDEHLLLSSVHSRTLLLRGLLLRSLGQF